MTGLFCSHTQRRRHASAGAAGFIAALVPFIASVPTLIA
jgi:hypothetical protein